MARLRKDHNAHIALEYEQVRGVSRFLYFTPSGLQRDELGTESFERRFKTAMDQPLGAAALRLLGLNRSAYLPDNRVNTILLEIYLMETTATTDLSSMTLDQLMVVYDGLRTVANKPAVKKFKSKGEAVKRIEALRAEIAALTPVQEEHRKERAEAADKRLASVKERAATERAERKVTPKAPKAPKAAPTKREPKPKGQGIGAFCMGLIQAGKSNEDVLAAVAEKFPDAKTSAASVAWYRSKLKSEGALS